MSPLDQVFTVVVLGWAAVTLFALRKVAFQPKLTDFSAAEPEGTKFPDVDLFDRLADIYSEEKKRVERLIALQAALVGVAIAVVVVEEGGSVTVPGGIALRADILGLLVPFTLLYAWTRFGLSLSQALECRSAMWVLLERIGDKDDRLPWLRPIFRDHGFIDAMFVYYYPQRTDVGGDQRRWLVAPYALVIMSFVAGVHGAILGSFWHAARVSDASIASGIGLFLILVAAYPLGLTHYQFARVQPSGRFQMVSVLLTVAATLGFQCLSLLG